VLAWFQICSTAGYIAASGSATSAPSTPPSSAPTRKAAITVSRGKKQSAALPLTVHYVLRGTATNGLDYAFLPGTIDIPAKKKSAKIVVQTLVDAIVENVETIEIELVPGEGYTIAGVTKATIPLFSKEK